MRAGPERTLIDDYLTRFDRTGRGLGFGPALVHEVEDRKGGGMTTEASLLQRAAPQGALIAILDERGRLMSSPDFATRLGTWRDEGHGDVAFMIGGADGVDPALRARADFVLSVG